MRTNETVEIKKLIIMMILVTVFAMFTKCINGKETEEPTSKEALATSHETEETSVIESETVNVTSTGIVAIQNVGMAATMDKLNEAIVATCEWSTKVVALTQSELELLYTTVYCEAGNQELEAQIMVAQTIINRILSNKYPDTLRGVVYQRNSSGSPQFSVINWPDFEKRGWTEQVKSAVHYALAYRAYPQNMYYFRSGDYYHDFGQPYKHVDDMFFSLSETEE